jgi:hypothetical protein
MPVVTGRLQRSLNKLVGLGDQFFHKGVHAVQAGMLLLRLPPVFLLLGKPLGAT